MSSIRIKVVETFNPKPYGRYPEDGDGCGQYFRENQLAPALREFDHVHVDLSGYNRYGRSFLDEAFGGLIRESGFSADEIANKLTYSHDLVVSILNVIDDRIEAAIRDTK
jgi:hypothetical protein